MWPLLVAGLLFHSAPRPARQPPKLLQQRSFDAGEDRCHFKIIATYSTEDFPQQKMTIACDGATIHNEDFKAGDVRDVSIIDNDGSVRLFIQWERGLVSGITVIQVSGERGHRSAKVIFDYLAKCGAEMLDHGDVIFANVGARFNQPMILPAGTNVYRWKDGKYVFDAGFQWKDDATKSDRFCILFHPSACPAVRTNKPARGD